MIEKFLIKLGSLDRRIIFIIIALSVCIPLLYPDLVKLPVIPKKDTVKVFQEIENLKERDKVIVSFEYGPSTMPEIHPMAIAILRHLFSKDILVYGFALWPDGNFMSTDAFSEVASEMGKKYDEDYVNLGFKPGGEAVIKGIASDIRTMYTVDLLGNEIKDLQLMQEIKNIENFDYVISLSAGDPGSKQWVQYATDPKKIPFTTGCTSIQVTDIIPYVENNQIRGILAGMPGAAEYENLVYSKYNQYNFKGEATGMMSAQSIAHLMIVIFIVFGNITYFLKRKRGAK